MRVRYFDTVQNLSTAISIIEEIQRLNRTGEWKVLLDRHLVFRRTLVEIKGSIANLDDDHKAVIQDGSLTQVQFPIKLNWRLIRMIYLLAYHG